MALFIFLVPLFLLGFILLIVGMAGRSRWMMLTSGILMFPLIAGFIVQARLPEVEWNPRITSDAQIVGTYADNEQSVTLRLDKTFTYSTASKTVSGTWQTDDWQLYLNVAAEPTYNIMQFIQSDGAYYLLPDTPEDLDEWDGDLGLPKVK